MQRYDCPRCAPLLLRHLSDLSHGAWVNYYRCDGCGQCYVQAKALPQAPLDEITTHRDYRPPTAAAVAPTGAGDEPPSLYD